MAEITTRVLGPADGEVLARVAPEVFDHPVDPALVRAFLAEPGHYLAVALDGDLVVGFASGVRYVHPDKPWALWINEVGVSPAWQRRGIGKAILRCLLDAAAAAGCTEAWVLTEADNRPARGLYESLGGGEEGEPPVMYSWSLYPEEADH